MLPEPRPYCLWDGTPLTLHQARAYMREGHRIYLMVEVVAADLGGLGA